MEGEGAAREDGAGSEAGAGVPVDTEGWTEGTGRAAWAAGSADELAAGDGERARTGSDEETGEVRDALRTLGREAEATARDARGIADDSMP